MARTQQAPRVFTQVASNVVAYAHYGLLGQTPQGANIPLALRGLAVEAQVVDFCVRNVITQRFSNDASDTVEAVYVFPMDVRAAIVAFESTIDG